MNKIFTTLLLGATAVAASTLLPACDNIDENDRYIELPVVEVQRTVLLEDFTGQNCKFCPNSHETIHALQEQYGDGLIAVSIHPAGNGLVYDEAKYGAAGLGTEDGRELAVAYGVSNSLPIGQIDRMTGLLDHPAWAMKVYEEVSVPSTLSCTGSAAIDDSTITVTLNVNPGEPFKGRVNVWVLEDSIVTRQTLPNGKSDNNYVHNHVLRQCITPALGQEAVYEAHAVTHETYSLPVKPHWNVAHLRVIAFFADEKGAVEQAVNIIPER